MRLLGVEFIDEAELERDLAASFEMSIFSPSPETGLALIDALFIMLCLSAELEFELELPLLIDVDKAFLFGPD